MKRHLLVSVALLLLAAAWATGCRGEPTTIAPADELNAAQVQDARSRELQDTMDQGTALVSQREEVTMTPLPTPEPTEVTPPAEAEGLVRLAREDLARQLGLAPEAIRLTSVEAVDWPDTSLGCPQPGMMYAQVITPGYLVVLKTDGEEYDYHTDRGDRVVLCQPEAGDEGVIPPVSPLAAPELRTLGAEFPAGAEGVVQLAREDLARRLGLAPDAVQLVSVEAVEWSDASLGCPQPGMMYAQVITPGFLVMLEAGGQTYEYHTDAGRFVVLCEK